MRYSLLIFLLICLLSLGSLYPSSVHAQLIRSNETVIITADEVIDDDLFLAGERVDIRGTVNGDVYVGSGNVDVSGTIYGDLLVGGGTIRIRGTIGDDVRVAGGNITVSDASIGGSLTTFGGNITVDRETSIAGSMVFGVGSIVFDGTTQRNLVGGGGNITINGVVRRQVQVGGGMIQLGRDAQVQGDIAYSSDRNIQVDEGAQVSGSVRHIPSTAKESTEQARKGLAGAALGFTLWSFIAFSIIGLLFWYLFPAFSTETLAYLTQNPGWAALKGFLVFILAFPILIVLALTFIGIPLAVIGVLAFFILIYISKLFPAVYLGSLITKPDSSTRLPWVQLLIGLVIYYVLSLIPGIGWLATSIWVLLGMGAVVSTVWKYLQSSRSS